MHILVVNDDGPPSNKSSPYIQSLVTTLQSAGHVVSVVLPSQQRSWISKAHIVGSTVKPTYYRPGDLHCDNGSIHSLPLDPQKGENGEEWILVDGTPASCVQIGLYHYFQDRGPVDLVLSGPNYGRNTTAIFGLSSGTIGGALEGAVCRKRSIALSYAFFVRDHDPAIIAAASRLSVKLIEHLFENWGKDVDLYSINVPLVENVETQKILYADMLENKWSSGSSFVEVEPEEGNEDPDSLERDIRESGEATLGPEQPKNSTKIKHKHFKWAPNFHDVYQSVEDSEPGNDGWAVKEGFTSVTALKANFMHAPGFEGEIKLSSLDRDETDRNKIYALVEYEDAYVQPLIMKAIATFLPPLPYEFIKTMADLPESSSRVLQIRPYEELDFEHVLAHPDTSLANAYVIRKALIRKHFLSNTVSTWIAKHPDSVLVDHVKPAVEFELDYAEFLDEALVEAYELKESFQRNEGKTDDEKEWWILKPSMSDRGQGIRLVSSEDELRSIFEQWEAEYPESGEEDDGKKEDYVITSQLRHFVVQSYIKSPLLLPSSSNRKFHIRTYVLAVGSLRVYVYRDMLALFAPQEYDAPRSGHTDLRVHLTNTCLQGKDTREGSVRRFWDLEELPGLVNWKERVFREICQVTGEVFEAAARTTTVHFQTLPNAFEAFGVDFLVDDQGRTWLLEINAFPDFRQTGPDLMNVVQGFWDGVVIAGIGGFFGDGRWDRDGLDKQGDMRCVLDIDLGRR